MMNSIDRTNTHLARGVDDRKEKRLERGRRVGAALARARVAERFPRRAALASPSSDIMADTFSDTFTVTSVVGASFHEPLRDERNEDDAVRRRDDAVVARRAATFPIPTPIPLLLRLLDVDLAEALRRVDEQRREVSAARGVLDERVRDARAERLLERGGIDGRERDARRAVVVVVVVDRAELEEVGPEDVGEGDRVRAGETREERENARGRERGVRGRGRGRRARSHHAARGAVTMLTS